MNSHKRSRTNRSSLLLTIAALSLLVAGCDGVGIGTGETGSGNLLTESRDVASFNRIEASGAINVELRVEPDLSHSVSVTYDDNILDNVDTRVAGNTLILELEGNLNLTGSVERFVAVTMPQVESLKLSGASEVRGTGSATAYELDASGASRADLLGLEAIDIAIDVSGASNVDLFATGTVSGSVSGASHVAVFGDPASALIDSSGASTVDVTN